MIEATATRASTRDRIIEAASSLLARRGQAAVTTRGVAELAGVQAPTIYRLFGDKEGLLDAVAEHAMTNFTASKARAAADVDPVAGLRNGWDMTIDFGLANPELFVLVADPARGQRSPAARAGIRLLSERVGRLARAGRLRVSESRAVELIHAAGTGAVLAILARPADQRDRRLADTLLDAVLDQILIAADPAPETGTNDVLAQVISLRTRTNELTALSSSEQTLLTEWLDRIIDDS